MNLRILFTILHDFIFFGISFFVALWVRLDLASASKLMCVCAPVCTHGALRVPKDAGERERDYVIV